MVYGAEYGKMNACDCGNPKPKESGCVDCGRQYCEQCAMIVDGDLVCTPCREKRAEADAEELPDPECTCTEYYVDVDRTEAYGPCDIHFPARPE